MNCAYIIMDCNSPSGADLQASNPSAALRNQVTVGTRILEASSDSCNPTEKSMKDMPISTSVESLHTANDQLERIVQQLP